MCQPTQVVRVVSVLLLLIPIGCGITWAMMVRVVPMLKRCMAGIRVVLKSLDDMSRLRSSWRVSKLNMAYTAHCTASPV